MKVFGYLRLFESEAKKGMGTGEQRDAIVAFANDGDHEIVDWFEDSYAETESIPPGYTALLGALGDDGVNAVIIQSMDRLGEKPGDRTLLLTELSAQDVMLICSATDEYVTQ